MDPQELKRLIEDGLPGAVVNIEGDGRHFQAVVVSDAFDGKPMLAQHRMVYAALGDRFQSEAVHALSLKTMTPREFEDAAR